MQEKIILELQELKNLTLLAAKDSYSMDDASLLTGLSKSTLYKLVHERKIDHHKSSGGKLTFFSKDDLQNWMLATKVDTVEETEAKAAGYVANKKSKLN